MTHIRGILIDPTRPKLNGIYDMSTNLPVLRSVVGGDLEATYGYRRPDNTEADEPRVTFLCNENGKCLVDGTGRPIRLPLNATATGLWWHYNPLMHGQDVFVGNILVFGGMDDDGDMLPVPQDVIDVYTALTTGDYAEQYTYLANQGTDRG